MDPVWKPFVCGECETKFESMQNLKKHLKEEHSDAHRLTDDRKKLIDELMKMNKNLETEKIALEMEVKASHKIIGRIKDENEKFKKGKNVADKVIQNLQDKLNLQKKDISDVKKFLDEKEKLILEKEALEKEVVEIQKENVLKEENLKTIMIEMKTLEDKLLMYKQKKVEEKNLQTDVLKVEEKNLQTDALMVEENNLQTDALMVEGGNLQTDTDDLHALNKKVHSKGIQCDPCGDIFEQKDIINIHQKNTHEDIYNKMKIIERELETKINLQRMHLVSDVLKLKQMEQSANGMCMCKRFCRIFHKKHNWQRSASHEIVTKLKNLQSCYSCNLCDETFVNVDTLNLHMKATHGERERKGGII